jgi:aldose 1-epimerase
MSVKLSSGSNTVTIDLEQGGRISSLVLLGRERMIGSPCSDEIEPGLAWGSFLMAPFVGRLKDGVVEWRGRTAQLRRNHGDHAIHGTVFDAHFAVTEQGAGHVVVACELDHERWPFGGRVIQRYALAGDSLTIEAEIAADEPMPAELGWHPWFVREGEMSVTVRSDRVLAIGPDMIPSGSSLAVDERHDLRSGPCLDSLRLDDVYVSAASPAVLCWPDLELRMGFSAPIGTFVVYTHAKAVCVEPQTSWPDAIRLENEGFARTGLASLEAGERLAASTIWSWTRRQPG